MANPTPTAPVSRRGDPPWEIAKVFPEQGYWDEHDFFSLPNTRGVELNDGMIEVLPVPKKTHEMLVFFLCKLIEAFVLTKSLGGVVLPSGFKIRIPSGNFRQPDVTYLTADQNSRANEDYTDSAELVIEIVSPGGSDRDYIEKPKEYALAGVPEYWIVDYLQGKILVLVLENGIYVEHGRFTAGQQVASNRFPGLGVAVDDVLKVGQ